MTVRGQFDENGFPYQKCSGKGASTPEYRREEFVGCFHATDPQVLLPHSIGNGLNVHFYDCEESCKDKGYHYFGRLHNGECRCSGISASNLSYGNEGQISMLDTDYCGDCTGSNIGWNKVCVFQIMDQFDPDIERARHPCSHITVMDLRRYCYVSCRDKGAILANLATCNSLINRGLIELNVEVASWKDSPLCDTKDCLKTYHPLGDDVLESKGTF